ncbi:condensation domain-containing protein, partial [Arhodomonas sp. AD133]|uniref:condensation domain-containing protein n=1 Tax=Arhodomonas sp. AD133 TaxID=3415009 RepID=UPI003EBC1165
FLAEGEAPLQWVARHVELPWTEADWRGRADQAEALERLAETQQRPFALAEPPLMRFALIRTGERCHHFIWSLHHLLLDGWSTSQLMGEVLRYYAGEALAAPAGGYRDYIAWLQGRDSGEAFWREQLARLAAPTRLADALPVPREPAPGHGEVAVTLDEASVERLTAFAQRTRVTVNTLVQGAWALVLSRYTGERTVSFGATVAGRPGELPGAERMLGLFINTLPVIVTVDPAATPAALLTGVQATNLALREYEHTPLYEIQRWAGYGGQGLFDSLLVFENYPVDEALGDASPGGVSFSDVRHQEATNYPLALGVQSGETIKLSIGYLRAHLDEPTANSVAQRLMHVLQQLADPQMRSFAEVESLDATERRQLDCWGVNPRRYPNPEPVPRLIERQAAATPQAPAVVFGAQVLTYAELNARANRLAHALIARGVGPETRVGVAMERSPELVVGLLAVLKAGGAYVPLDPEHPRERLAYLIEDSGIAL